MTRRRATPRRRYAIWRRGLSRRHHRHSSCFGFDFLIRGSGEEFDWMKDELFFSIEMWAFICALHRHSDHHRDRWDSTECACSFPPVFHLHTFLVLMILCNLSILCIWEPFSSFFYVVPWSFWKKHEWIVYRVDLQHHSICYSELCAYIYIYIYIHMIYKSIFIYKCDQLMLRVHPCPTIHVFCDIYVAEQQQGSLSMQRPDTTVHMNHMSIHINFFSFCFWHENKW